MAFGDISNPEDLAATNAIIAADPSASKATRGGTRAPRRLCRRRANMSPPLNHAAGPTLGRRREPKMGCPLDLPARATNTHTSAHTHPSAATPLFTRVMPPPPLFTLYAWQLLEVFGA